MMKAMLSQPMNGKTDEEIIATREKAVKVLQEKGYEIVNTLFTDEWYSNERMKERGSSSDSVVFPCEIFGKYEFMSCSIFLQGLGECKRVQD